MTKISEKDNMLELFSKNVKVSIYVSEKENSAVHIAVDNFIKDIKSVFGCEALRSNRIEKADIIIGTIDGDNEFMQLIKDKELPVDMLEEAEGKFHSEGYLQIVNDNLFYIVGTDRRGTVFGIYDLCEKMGVSPWYYWADISMKRKDFYQIPTNYVNLDWPSVSYRGIFINDEEELEEWAKLHTSDGTIGPIVYEKMFELLLRLKANYIWPAMHVNYFNENLENGALAERMGIVVGTSHCDMLLRSNQNEWHPWIEKKGYLDAVYDYSIEGRNREILKEYWKESVEQNKDYEVCYTMGMRGIHDSGFHTKSIDENKALTKEEKLDAKIALLGQVVKDQRQILREVIGEEGEKKALETFVPYKEVLDLYNQGLDLPEDITLIWANDNYGHMRRYPNELEKKREGGNGLYFHSSYWAAPGTAMSYLFINSTPLAHTGNELRKSYESGIRKIWVLNVGGLKPVEQDMEFFIRYAWDAGKDKEIVRDASKFTEKWINSNFTGNHGAELAEIYNTFAQVTNVRKIEHMNSKIFSQTAYGDEAGRRLMRLEEIFGKGNEILMSLPEEERYGFFQLILMKIHASYYTNHEYYYADRSRLSYDRGNMQAADYYTLLSEKMTEAKRVMLHFYNKKMSNGKWDEILTPESFSPPPTAMHPVRKPALEISGSGLRVDIWNEEEEINFYSYGRKVKWIELGNQGEGNIPFEIDLNEAKEWINISESEGILQTEKRILISIKDPIKNAGKNADIFIKDLRNKKTISVKVKIEERIRLEEGFLGYVEADGYISMPAEGYNKKYAEQKSDWLQILGMGRYEGSAMMAWNQDSDSLDREISNNPCLEYNIHLQSEGKHILEIHRFLTLNSTGKIRLGIACDDSNPIIVETETVDEWKGLWQDSVFNNGEKLLINLPFLSMGAHTIKIYMIDNYLTISKLVIYTKGVKETNLGPSLLMLNNEEQKESGFESPNVMWEGLERLRKDFYITEIEEVEHPNMLYATRDFFENEQVYNKCINRPQIALGVKRYDDFWKCTREKDIKKEFATGVFCEEAGVLAIEAEYALENTGDAYLTQSKEGNNISWSHLKAETDGKTGLAMHIETPGILWINPDDAPGMHYRVHVGNPGTYHVWLLLRHYNNKSDSCYFALDGENIPVSEQFGKGVLHTYNTSQVYYWCHMLDMKLDAGKHLFSIIGKKSELRIDRIFITKNNDLPPWDEIWVNSIRGF